MKKNGHKKMHRLRAWRVDHGFSQQALAVRLGIHQVSISRYESGALPSLSHRQAIREVTGIAPSWWDAAG